MSIIQEIADIVGQQNVLTGADVKMRSVTWGTDDPCRAKAIVRPKTTQELSQIMKLCFAENQQVVVHGGLTGLVGGAIADEDQIVVSLERMNAIEKVDPTNRTMTVGAGVRLQEAQQAAEANGLFFALDIGARGSATIGGTIATNAGGLNVVRFGMMRDQVLGLEIVLPDGQIVSMLNECIKNNAGYDLKHIFIGSEGTLGIVTRAVLRLRFMLPRVLTALVSVDRFQNAVKLLHDLENDSGGAVTAFEVMWPDFFARESKKNLVGRLPLPEGAGCYALIEVLLRSVDVNDSSALEWWDEKSQEGKIGGIVVAQSEQQRAQFWKIRDTEDLLSDRGRSAHFDISLPVQNIPEYLSALKTTVLNLEHDARIMPFGHLGDNNLHLTITIARAEETRLQPIKDAVYDELKRFNGSVSAEHGIGRDKREYLKDSKSSGEIAIMKMLKENFDPSGILNRRAVI